MNFWPTMQEMLSPDDAGKPTSEPNAGRPATALKPLPEDALIIIPLRNAVLFPGIMSPVTIGRPSSVAAHSTPPLVRSTTKSNRSLVPPAGTSISVHSSP